MSNDNALRSTISLMARDNDNEALIALRHATRMLAMRGLNWSDIASLAIAVANDDRHQASTVRPQAQTQPKPKAVEIHVSGYDIPKVVEGELLLVMRERTRSGGIRLVFNLSNGDTTYGPIVSYQMPVTLKIEHAVRHGKKVRVLMLSKGEGRPPTATNPYMPQAGDVKVY